MHLENPKTATHSTPARRAYRPSRTLGLACWRLRQKSKVVREPRPTKLGRRLAHSPFRLRLVPNQIRGHREILLRPAFGVGFG